MPTLSVIMPNYNHAKYLHESLEAILNQSFQPKEIVVVDDASTDNSCSIIESYAKKHPNLTLIKLSNNSGGPTVPCEEGLKRVTGDFLSLCAADDMILPGFYAEAMQLISDHSEVAICCGDMYVFTDSKKPYRFRRQQYLAAKAPVFFSPDMLAQTCLKTAFQIASQASLYRKDTLGEVGFYDIELDGYSDFYLNYKIGFKYPIVYAPQPWATHREISTSYGQNVSRKKRYELMQKFLNKINKEPKAIRNRWRNSGILIHTGPVTHLCLITRPEFWSFLPRFYLKGFVKLFKKILAKIATG